MNLTQAVVDFFVCLVRFAVGLIRWSLVEVINELLAIFGWLTALVAPLIPLFNFEIPVLPEQWAGYVNWVFPLGFLAELYGYIIAAFAVYRIVRWMANRAKGPIQPKLF